MKYRDFFMLFIFTISLNGCSIPLKKKHDPDIALKLIDNYLKSGISDQEMTSLLGKPTHIKTFKGDLEKTYIYEDPKTGNQEWGIGINTSGKASGLGYAPPPNSQLNTVDNLLHAWKHYKCEKKSETVNKPHVIKEVHFIICYQGRIKAFYNRYNEITNIAVK